MKKIILFIIVIIITTISYGQRPTVEQRGTTKSTTAVRTKDRTSTQRNYKPVERRKPNKQVQHKDGRDNRSKPIKPSNKRNNKHHLNKPHHEKHPHHQQHISHPIYHPHRHTHVRMHYYFHNHFLYSNLYWYDIDFHRIKILSRETDGYYVYSLIRDKSECQSYLIISDIFDKVYAKIPVKRKYKRLMVIDNFVYLLTNSNDFIGYQFDLDNNQLLFFQEIID